MQTENLIYNGLLNDDCLLEIFQNFELKDLIIVVRVSKQFESIAKQAFRSKFKKLRLSDYFYSINTELFNKVFIHFGHLIEEIDTISDHYPWFSHFTQSRVISLVSRYCTNLKSLKFSFFSSIDQELHKLENIFENLQTLTLSFILIPYSLGAILNLLPKAREVTLTYLTPLRTLTQTTEICQNLNMQKLQVRTRHDMNIIQILTVVDDAFPNLIDFQFEIFNGMQRELFEQYVHRIAGLTKLKFLDIPMMFLDPTPLLRELVEKKIELISLKIDDISEIPMGTIMSIYKIKSLEQLYIFDTIRPPRLEINIKKLISWLGNLQILSIRTEPLTIEKITEIVSMGENLTHVEFNLKSESRWNAVNHHNLSKIVGKRRGSKKLILSLHKEEDTLEMAYESWFLIDHKNDPNIEVRQRWNEGRSVFKRDW